MPAPELDLLKQSLDTVLRNQKMFGAEANSLLNITATKYRFRSGALQVLTGDLTGNDAIVSDVVIKNIADGVVPGKEQVVTHNPTVISEAKNLVETHADKIISSLSD